MQSVLKRVATDSVGATGTKDLKVHLLKAENYSV